MRRVLLAVLVIAPVALVGWMVYRARTVQRVEPAPAPESRRAENPDDALLALLQTPLAGATAKGKPSLYDSDRLFEYIDGAAPGYIERHFRRLAALELVTTAAGGEVTCDVYDMSTPQDARAMFESERTAGKPGLEGLEPSQIGPMSLVFAAGRCYVKLTAFDAVGEAALPAIARALRERIR